MAERRMFAKTIVLSDDFLDMPLSARCLYFTLGMLADDDGFVNSPKAIMRQCGASNDDMNVLLAKKFLLMFDDGVMVIKHWRINNYLRNDRYKETLYVEHKEQLTTNEYGAYSLSNNVGIPNTVYPGKDRLGKDSIGNRERRFTPPSLQEVTDYCNQRGNNVDPERFVNFYQSKNWMVGKNKMRDWKAAIITWEKRDQDKAKGKRTQTDEEFEEELRRFMENDES